jgi:hypothetical protein
MSRRLSDKVCIITGTGGSMGRAQLRESTHNVDAHLDELTVQVSFTDAGFWSTKSLWRDVRQVWASRPSF